MEGAIETCGDFDLGAGETGDFAEAEGDFAGATVAEDLAFTGAGAAAAFDDLGEAAGAWDSPMVAEATRRKTRATARYIARSGEEILGLGLGFYSICVSS